MIPPVDSVRSLALPLPLPRRIVVVVGFDSHDSHDSRFTSRRFTRAHTTSTHEHARARTQGGYSGQPIGWEEKKPNRPWRVIDRRSVKDRSGTNTERDSGGFGFHSWSVLEWIFLSRRFMTRHVCRDSLKVRYIFFLSPVRSLVRALARFRFFWIG